MTWRLLLRALAVLATPAFAQVSPAPGPGDPRIQSIAYDANQVVQLAVAPNYQLTIEFAPDEKIENVALGDSGAWSASANRRGDHLFVKAIRPGAGTNMLVVTDARTYNFDLAPLYGPMPTMAYIVRFTYPPAAGGAADGDGGALGDVAGRYELRGERALRPAAMDDDGAKTRIVWAPERAMPAIFAIDPRGNEVLVNGAVRDGIYVIDAIYQKLVFRIDQHSASATRRPVRR